MANTVLRKDYSGAANKQKQTISVWVKRCNGLTGNQAIFSVRHTGNANFYGYLRFKTDSSLQFYNNSPSINVRTTRLFRDINAWYHIVITVDTTQSTTADRIKMYINGVQETSFQNSDYPSQNAEVTFGDDYRHEIGSYDASYYFEGVMSHFHYITNTAYQASTFGSTDATTGEWQINTSPSVTYATNSFFLLKDGNSVTDQSGQGNNYTVAGGNLIKSEDCPSNVFAVLNPLSAQGSSITIAKGATEVNFDAGGYHAVYSTIGATSGKYYAECLVDAVGTSTSIGIISADTVNDVQQTGDGDYMGKESDSIGYVRDGEMYKANNLQQTIATYTTNDIISLAFDLDNNTIQFYKNGSSVGNTVSLTANKTYMIGSSGYNGSRQRWNFGNGYFGNSTVSSAGTNASGNGIFEYDVPANFTALSTKGLNL